jgi:hypothetical protein
MAELLRYNLKTVRAYLHREDFQRFWTYMRPWTAKKFLRECINQYKVGKHFRLKITETSFHYERKNEKIKAEAALDGTDN